MSVLGCGQLGAGDEASGVGPFFTGVERCDRAASLNLQREHALLGLDALADGEAGDATRGARDGAGDERLGVRSAGEGGEDVGMGDTTPPGVAGRTLQHGHGKNGLALGEVLAGEDDGLVGCEPALAGRRDRKPGRAGLGVGNEGAAHVLAEAEFVGAGAPCGSELALVDGLSGRAGVECDNGLLRAVAVARVWPCASSAASIWA